MRPLIRNAPFIGYNTLLAIIRNKGELRVIARQALSSRGAPPSLGITTLTKLNKKRAFFLDAKTI